MDRWKVAAKSGKLKKRARSGPTKEHDIVPTLEPVSSDGKTEQDQQRDRHPKSKSAQSSTTKGKNKGTKRVAAGSDNTIEQALMEHGVIAGGPAPVARKRKSTKTKKSETKQNTRKEEMMVTVDEAGDHPFLKELVASISWSQFVELYKMIGNLRPAPGNPPTESGNEADQAVLPMPSPSRQQKFLVVAKQMLKSEPPGLYARLQESFCRINLRSLLQARLESPGAHYPTRQSCRPSTRNSMLLTTRFEQHLSSTMHERQELCLLTTF